MTNKEYLEDFNKFRASHGEAPLAPPAKFKRARSLSISDEAWEGMRSLAARCGYTSYLGGNITALIEALGHDLWILRPKYDKD